MYNQQAEGWQFTTVGTLTHSVRSVTFSSVPCCWRSYTSATKLLFNTQRGISLRAVFFGMTLLLVSGVVRRQAFLYFHQRLEGSRAVRTVFKGSGVGTIH